MKRFLFLGFTLLCSLLLCGTALAASATPPAIPTEGDVWDGTTKQPSELIKVDGIYYYNIHSCDELAYIAKNGGVWLTYNYMLQNDLILNDVILTWNEVGTCTNTEKLLEWAPIGSSVAFTGIFDGNNHTITGAVTIEPDKNAGIFSNISEATIKDLSVVNSLFLGSWSTGGIVAESKNSNIENCQFSGCVKAINGNTTSNHGCGGICGYINYGTLSSCKNYGTIIADYHGGGIVGRSTISIEACQNYGDVYCISSNSMYLGGIVGRCTTVRDCNNYGNITGGASVGGICGFINYYLSGCSNFGKVRGKTSVGGIAGTKAYAYILSTSINYGEVFGDTNIGGIAGEINGDGSAITSYNVGRVNGTTNVGGIAGKCASKIADTYNAGKIEGTSYVGGISGYTVSCTIVTSYNVGQVVGQTNTGGIVGTESVAWGHDTITDTYFLRTDIVNTSLYGSGFLCDVDGIEALNAIEAKIQESYSGFDFKNRWVINVGSNGGYPYLQWQSLETVPVTGVSLNKATLALGVGDAQYLTATVSPATAETTLSWKSSNTAVATVTKSGKVTALASGSADITVTTQDGGFSATCAVTVMARSDGEYRVNSITLQATDGTALSSVPKGACLVTVSVTRLEEAVGDACVLLAAYSDKGQYQGLMWVSLEDVPEGATVKVTLPVDNSSGKIAKLQAFVVPSLADVTPIGT